jgi:GNAT superfamily N-acetyltransferase
MDIEIKFLADVPFLVPVLAQWTYDAWSKYDPELTVDRVMEGLIQRFNRDMVPLTLVAFDGDTPVGMASLKEQIRVPGYSDKTPWLGSLYVIPTYQNHGVGTQLMQAIHAKAAELGFKNIYLFTSDSSQVSWYEKIGWQQFAMDTFHGKPITLMTINVS